MKLLPDKMYAQYLTSNESQERTGMNDSPGDEVMSKFEALFTERFNHEFVILLHTLFATTFLFLGHKKRRWSLSMYLWMRVR